MVTAEHIIRQFNTWLFKREQPSDLQLLIQTVEHSIANNNPINFILYWGKGDRYTAEEIEEKTLTLLSRIRTRIESVYSTGTQFTILFTDTHAQLNGYSETEARQYFQSMERLTHTYRFHVDYLSRLAPYNKESLEVCINDICLAQGLQTTLVDMASKHYKGDQDFQIAALLYYAQNQIEKVEVERAYPHSIFLTFNGSELRQLFPEKLPIFYAYSYKKGTSVKPWFTNREDNNDVT